MNKVRPRPILTEQKKYIEFSILLKRVMKFHSIPITSDRLLLIQHRTIGTEMKYVYVCDQIALRQQHTKSVVSEFLLRKEVFFDSQRSDIL